MNIYNTPFIYQDCYKNSHVIMLPPDITYMYANCTPRRSLRPGVDKFVFFGLQAFLKDLTVKFNNDFFGIPKEQALLEYSGFFKSFLGKEPNSVEMQSISDLWDLQYLPLKIKALQEGSVVNHGVPVLTVENTDPRFPWITNFIETWLSTELWQTCTSATTSFYYRMASDRYAKLTSDLSFMPDFQNHDFSMRGMASIDAGAKSAAAVLLSTRGTDTLTAMKWIHDYYPGSDENELIGTSVPATEHSIMCADGKDNEIKTIERLLGLYPNGILSIVSDTWDLWGLVTKFLPQLKEQIMSRAGKIVIRPDSGDPVKIICGDTEAQEECVRKGLIECLYDIFGGTVNSKGYIELDQHIGAIYGDGISLERQGQIYSGLMAKGFSSTNIVLGCGSMSFTLVTRDTHSIAMKSTAVGKGWDKNKRFPTEIIPIFKDPKTDNSGKKSARGLLSVVWDEEKKEYHLIQDATETDMEKSALKPVYLDGKILNHQSFSDVRRVLESHKEILNAQ